jgi:hypothetical protein
MPFWHPRNQEQVQRRTITTLNTPFGLRPARAFEVLFLRGREIR